MHSLRPYQREAIDALYRYFAHQNGNPLIVLPTGSGKSLVQAALIQESLEKWPKTRFLCVTHVKELIRQNADELRQLWFNAPLGVYSAGLGRRDTDQAITFAGIASIYDKAPALGRVDLVIIDECHLVPARDTGMYRQLLRELRVVNPAVKVVGLTATPYRLGTGSLTESLDDNERIFTDIAYEANLSQLIADGYLAPLISKGTQSLVDYSQVSIRGGEYVQSELEAAMDRFLITNNCLSEVESLCGNRTCWLFFCAGVKHAEHVCEALNKKGYSAGCITGETGKEERDLLIQHFKEGRLRALTNANVLTTGFNVPQVDMLVMLRPTMSTSLYVQMMGRGMRNAAGKKDCLVLDYAGNVMRHGPVDAIEARAPKKRGKGEAPCKMCPKCQSIIHTSKRVCPDCGYEYPDPELEAKLNPKASELPVLTSQMKAAVIPKDFDVHDMTWRVHLKAGADENAPKTLKVTYDCGGLLEVNEFMCFEHTGYARQKACEWWRATTHGDPPATSLEALDILDERLKAKQVRKPSRIIVAQPGKWPEVRARHYDAIVPVTKPKPKPCAQCVHHDGGHCLSWGLDIPADWLAKGCERYESMNWRNAPVNATLKLRDLVPEASESDIPF